MNSAILLDENYPIRPSDIDSTKFFWDSFGNSETEGAAIFLVRFCQSRNSWDQFLVADLCAYYKRERFNFQRLVTDRHIEVTDGVVTLTHRFISKCFVSSPKARSLQATLNTARFTVEVSTVESPPPSATAPIRW